MAGTVIVGDFHIGNQVSSRSDDYFCTCLAKLDQILRNFDEIIFLGDIFNTPTLPLEKIQVLFKMFKMWNRDVYTIIGNHDVYEMNTDLSKTALGLLEAVGVIKVLRDNETFELNHFHITALPLKFEDIKPLTSEVQGHNILLGHHFFGLNCSDSLTGEYVKENFKGFSHLILGHDHQSYEPTQAGDMRVLRPGSVLRNACTEYNMTRKPQYLYWNGETFVAVPLEGVKPAEEVFTKSAFNKTLQKEKAYLESLDNLLESQKNKVDFKTKKVRSLKKILEKLDIPRDSMDYLLRLHNRLMITLE